MGGRGTTFTRRERLERIRRGKQGAGKDLRMPCNSDEEKVFRKGRKEIKDKREGSDRYRWIYR